MSTFLSKLFKPKWQSKNTTTRKEAIAGLNPNQEDEQKILLELARFDKVEEIRTAALNRISDSQVLAHQHKTAEGQFKADLEARLYELANSQSLSIFDLIVDANILTDMIVNAASPDTFINGLARIEDAPSLLKIALNSKTSKIRQAAAELLETEQELKELTQAVKSKDKGVYHIAKAKLDKLRTEAKTRQELVDRISGLIEAVEEHARTDNTKLYDSKLDSLVQRWNEVSAQADTSATEQFATARKVCQQRIDESAKADAEAAEAELMAKAGGDELKATLLTLEQTLSRFRESPATLQEVSSLDAILKTQETRWLEATKQVQVEKSEQKHYQVLMGELRKYLSAQQQLAEQSEQLESLCDDIKSAQKSQEKEQASRLEKASKAIRRSLGKIDWPVGFKEPELINQAQSALGISQDLNKKLARSTEEVFAEIESKIDQLDTQLDDKQVKGSSRTLKQIQSLISQLNSKQGDKVHAQLNLRIKQLNDLRDWQGFASSPRQQELCELMERLAEQTIAPQEKADKIKAMQQEWKSLGGASDESLWQRFKGASDKAFEPCKAYFSEQSALKDNNLEKRRTLIDQLAGFLENNDWEHADWKAADQINRKARQEWREAYPVDHRKNRPLQKQFNTLLDKLDDQLDGEREKNLGRKTAIVEQAEALVAHEELAQAINEAKNLQKQWQDIGITEHKKDRALWKRFRQACDAIFARRDQQREARHEEYAAAQQEAESLISKYRELLLSEPEKEAGELKSILDTLRKENKELPSLGSKANEKHQEAFEELIKDAKSLIKKQKNVLRLAQWQEAARVSSLLRNAYLEQGSDQEAIEGALASQSKNSLQSDIYLSLKELWIGIKAGSLKPGSIIDEVTAREFCIRCEIAAGMESPESDKELRMQLQVTRLSEGMSSSESASREEQLESLLKEWFAKVGLPGSAQSSFDARINATAQQLFAAK